jgi:hypothetical protein
MVFAVGAPDDTSRFRSPRLDRGTASTLADHRPLACALQILASRLKGGFMANIGSVRQVGHADLGLQSIAAPAPQLALVAGGMICLATALLLLGARLYAFEAVVAAAAALLSADGVVDAGNRRALSLALLAAAGLAALAVPAAPLVLAASTATGALFISLHLVGSRLGAPIGPLFQKEGFFEMVTAALALASAAWSAAAALRWKRHEPQLPRGAPVLYAALALTLFLFAMEELNWGQTLLGFDTPAAWAEINYQQQTSLHNVIDAPLLELVERVLIVAFGFVVLGLIALALKLPRSTFATIAPPASLVVLATLCWIPGAYLRLEVTELLFALFFAFYCYRIDVAASLKPAAG